MQEESSVRKVCKMEKHHSYEQEERYLHLLLMAAIYDKKADLRQLTNEVDRLEQQLPQHTTWMKYHLICFSNYPYSQGGRGTKIHVYLPYRGAI